MCLGLSSRSILKRPKATSPIPICALKFHPRSIRTYIQDQKASALFYLATPAPIYCFDFSHLWHLGIPSFLSFLQVLLCIYSVLLFCYIFVYSAYTCWGDIASSLIYHAASSQFLQHPKSTFSNFSSYTTLSLNYHLHLKSIHILLLQRPWNSFLLFINSKY